jgi:hypothetical protein
MAILGVNKPEKMMPGNFMDFIAQEMFYGWADKRNFTPGIYLEKNIIAVFN